MTVKNLAISILAATLIIQAPVSALAASDNTAAISAGKAIQYLMDNQADDGSLPQSTDWSVVALVAGDRDPEDATLDYLENVGIGGYNPADTLAARILSLTAAGQDTSSYKQLLASETYYHDHQIGDETSLSEDIFAVMAIAATGDSSLYPIAQDSLKFVINNQEDDGGFGYSTLPCSWTGCTDSDTDMTAAAIAALTTADKIGLTDDDLTDAQAALDDALEFLLYKQNEDGSFTGLSNGPSTAWALMALNSLGDSVQAEATEARDWLLEQQNTESYGFFDSTWGFPYDYTADAILAVLGTTWMLTPAPLEIPVEEPEDPVVVLPAATTKPTPTTPEPTFQAQTQPIEVAVETDNVLGDDVQDISAEDTGTQSEPEAEDGSNLLVRSASVILAIALIGFGWHLLKPKKS